MTDLIGHTLGLYEIIEEIGHGGMADVYRAVQPSIGRQVAVKVLPAHFLQDRTFLERFNREVRVIAKLQHPRILPIYDFGQHEGMPYIVMAYMSGGTLAARIRESGNGLPLSETARLVGQIAEGLDFAHRQGVIHRDFKPSNVLLDVEGNAYLADFGVAKVTEATAQLTGSGIVGTPAYMAPEMARLGGVSSLVDVYALGTTLFQMLTGQLPYQADTPMGVLMAHASMPIPDVRELRPDLPEEVQGVIELGMAKEPMDRYQSAGEIAAGLHEAARMSTVSASDQEETRSAQPTTHRAVPSPSDALTADLGGPPESTRASEDLGRTLPAAAYVAGPTDGAGVPSLPYPEQEPLAAPTAQRRKVPVWLWGIGAVIAALALGGGLIALWPSLSGGGGSAEPVEIRWFAGLVSDLGPEEVADQQKFVDAFNATHPNIRLRVEVVPNEVAFDELRARMASGDAPDIVGPTGIWGMNNFYGEWLDLAPLMEEVGYDTSDFDPVTIKYYQFGPEGEQVGIPFEIYPSALWYNVDLFDAAGVPYPPHQYGEPYADGSPWSFDKLRQIAMTLTLDTSGRSANDRAFDAEHIVQFGFDIPWLGFRGKATLFGAGSLVDEQGNAVMPTHWRDFWMWYYEGIWRDNFIPTNQSRASDTFRYDIFGGNGFATGKVAMIPMHLWYTCCMSDTVRWNVAAIPFVGSQGATVPLHADSFGILASAQHPREAFEVLSYMLGEGAPDLLAIYGGFPARRSLQGDAIASYNEMFPIGVDWAVFLEGLQHADNPSHEAYLPNMNAADGRLEEFAESWQGKPRLELEAELNRLRYDLQFIYGQK